MTEQLANPGGARPKTGHPISTHENCEHEPDTTYTKEKTKNDHTQPNHQQVHFGGARPKTGRPYSSVPAKDLDPDKGSASTSKLLNGHIQGTNEHAQQEHIDHQKGKQVTASKSETDDAKRSQKTKTKKADTKQSQKSHGKKAEGKPPQKKTPVPAKPPIYKGLCKIYFHYLDKGESARFFLHENIPSNIKIIEEITPKTAERRFGSCSSSFHATIDMVEAEDIRVLETLLSMAWFEYHPDIERKAWLEIRPNVKRFYNIKRVVSTTTFERVHIEGGCMTDPQTFVCHWEQNDNKVVFEHDKRLLLIYKSVNSNTDDVLEIPYDSIEDAIPVSCHSNVWSFFVCLKHNPIVYQRTTKKPRNGIDRIEDARQCETGMIRRQDIGKTSTICLQISDDKTGIQRSDKTETNDVWSAIIRLKWIGFSLSYVKVDRKMSDDANGVQRSPIFSSFNQKYAWKCLISCGYKVLDHLNPETLQFIQSKENEITRDLLYNVLSKVESSPFVDLKKCIEDALVARTHNTIKAEKEELPSNFSMVRRLVVTPTSKIFLRDEPMVQNRILRQYDNDFFIRVIFRDEDFTRLSATQPDALLPVITRFRRFMDKGFSIGDRKYEFLACSNSQLREHGVWFFAEYDNITAEMIRKKAGDLSSIRCIASYVSRLGLCFSASRDTIDVAVEEGSVEYVDDIKRNDYCFTDGVGKISCNLAEKVAEQLEMYPVPSAFQIRYGGCKGVVSQDPTLEDKELLVIRESMNKFLSPSKNLEILTITHPGRLHLNKQVITLLQGLNVPEKVFLSLQERMLFNMADMMLYDDKAVQALSEVSMNIKYKSLSRSGFILTREPFFRSVLITLYRSKLGELVRKARIEIPYDKGRIMMGTVDETGLLEYGQVFISYSRSARMQHDDAIVHTGDVVVTKNPCFHPGDVQKFQALDIPELYHMVDCIVFPQNGKRPHPDEMSGSDLDGDMYFVCWDPDLLPPQPNEEPMKYPSADKEKLPREVKVTDVTKFIANYIKNDQLGVIANAHVVHADLDGIKCYKCIELSKMHSKAVDFAKTGKSPTMTRELRVEKYPDFMSKRDKPSYRSKKVLGKLFRECRSLEQAQVRSPQIGLSSTVVDLDLICTGYEDHLLMAHVSYSSYANKITQLMSLYGIETEAEVVTGVIRKLKQKRGYLQNERFEIGQIVSAKMSVLRTKTRAEFFEEFGGEEKVLENEEIDRDVLAKASAWYMTVYDSGLTLTEQMAETKILSFPWIISDLLSVIKSGKQSPEGNEEPDKVSNRYQSGTVLSQIGTSLLRYYDSTSNDRLATYNFLSDVAFEVIHNVFNRAGILVSIVGTLRLNLMDPFDRNIELCLQKQISFKQLEPLFRNSLPRSMFVSMKGNTVCLNRDGEHVQIILRTKRELYRTTNFALQKMANDDVCILVVHFMLAWARNQNIAGKSRSIFAELDFVTMILKMISLVDNRDNNKLNQPATIDPSHVQLLSVGQMESSDISKAADILLSILRKFNTVFEDSKKGIELTLLDPSDSSGKHMILSRLLKPTDGQRFLREVLIAYQDIIKFNSVDGFFGHAILEDGHMTYNLPLDIWGSVMFAEKYTEKRLSEKTGAKISIRRTKFRDIPGLVLEAIGNPDQLWNVQQSLNDLGEKSSQFISTSARDKAFIQGAYRFIFEGFESKSQNVQQIDYTDQCQPHHDGKALSIPRIANQVQNSQDLDVFKEIFKTQLSVVKTDYDQTYHGVLRIALAFGIHYFINADDGLSIEELKDKMLENTNIKKRRLELRYPGNWHGKRGRGRGRGNRTTYSSLMPQHTPNLRSSFMPKTCNGEKTTAFLEAEQFSIVSTETKYHVTFKCGDPDFGKQHDGIVILDKDLSFVEFRLSDLKWLAVDTLRGVTDDLTKLTDVRCKIQSRRMVDIESVKQIDDVSVLLSPETRLLRLEGDKLYINEPFHDRATFVRKKKSRSYKYSGPKTDDSIWHDMKIEVSTVTEYSHPDEGQFDDRVVRKEVVVEPKFPNLDDDEVEQEEYAKKIWMLIQMLGKLYD